ncbi:DnaB-like helicase C-terminal domain-containing protein [Chromobacterium haemolyticum]|uniref:DnaB-like helicase C-terminal domain-containing protein n=1 Tax=Chromobacterium TaxID=535 RepID=UPI004057619F
MSHEGALLTHQPCSDCGSSDGLAVYPENTYCFVCEKSTPTTEREDTRRVSKGELISRETHQGEFKDLRARGISRRTCEHYGYWVGRYNGKAVQVADIKDMSGDVIHQKLRFPDKEFLTLGGTPKCFVGQHLFPGKGRKVVITEGEIDMLSIAQLDNCQWPVVSVPNGAKAAKKVFKEQYEWLIGFDEVVIAFDMDTPGREAATECAQLLPPGKAKLLVLSEKDANKMLMEGKEGELKKALWNAQPYRPDGIINGNSLKDAIKARGKEQGLEWPEAWRNMPIVEYTKLIPKKKLIVVGAGSSVGKSTFTRFLAYYLGVQKDTKIGMVYLEESAVETGQALMSYHCGTRLHLEDVDETTWEDAFSATLGSGNFALYDAFGSIESGNLLSRIRYLAVAEECEYIILDHLSIAISGLEGSDERKLIDKLMTDLRCIVEETGCTLIVVSHLTRKAGDGKAHEEGGQVSTKDFRGSGAILQLADVAIGLERNTQDKVLRDYTTVRILKVRYTGLTGIGGYLLYDHFTGRLNPVDSLPDDGESPAGEGGW